MGEGMWALLFRCSSWAWLDPRGPTQDALQPCILLSPEPGRAAGCGWGRVGGGEWEPG